MPAPWKKGGTATNPRDIGVADTPGSNFVRLIERVSNDPAHLAEIKVAALPVVGRGGRGSEWNRVAGLGITGGEVHKVRAACAGAADYGRNLEDQEWKMNRSRQPVSAQCGENHRLYLWNYQKLR